MKKLKITFLMFILIFISGCEIKYNLNFEDGVVSENINIILTEKESTKDNGEFLKSSLEYRAYAISNQWDQRAYNTEVINKNGLYTGVLNYKYTPEEFNTANLIHQCYDSFNFVEVDDGYALATSDVFKCLDFDYMPVDKYDITITTDRVVVSHNADIVEDNKYIWVINSNGNVEIEKPIKIKFSDMTKSDELKENMRENSSLIVIILLSLLCLAALIASIVLYKNKKNNS